MKVRVFVSTTMADGHLLRRELSKNAHLGCHPALRFHTRRTGAQLHLAVMTGPYLDLVVSGVKTVESRFHRVTRSPLHTATPGDLIAFKPSGGAVTHVAGIHAATYIDLADQPIEVVREEWQHRVAATDDDFWSARAQARWASLLELGPVEAIEPVPLGKRDRRAWVTYPPCCAGT